MKTFEDWYKELTSDTLWYELLRHYKDETIRKCSEKVYAQLVAEKTVSYRPMTENRKHVYNVVCKLPGDKPKVDWVEKQLKQQEEEKKEAWVPVSWEKRAEYLNKVQEIIKGSTMANAAPRMSYKEIADSGDVLPPKPKPYPQTSPEEFYLKQRRLAYIKHAYEPRTAELRPGAMSETDFNLKYDQENL